jgi:hypothetical protein
MAHESDTSSPTGDEEMADHRMMGDMTDRRAMDETPGDEHMGDESMKQVVDPKMGGARDEGMKPSDPVAGGGTTEP